MDAACVAEHCRFCTPGTPNLGIRRSEQHYYWQPERSGHVGRSAVVSNEEGRSSQERLDFFQRRARHGWIPGEFVEAFAGPCDKNRLDAELLFQVLGELQELNCGPSFILRGGFRMQDGVRSFPMAQRGKETRSRNLCWRQAQEEYRGGKVLRGMGRAAHRVV